MIPKIISSFGIKNPDKLLTDKNSEFERDWKDKPGLPTLVLEVNGYVEKISYIDGNGIDYCTVSYWDGSWKEITNLHLSSWQTRKELEVNREISRIKFSGNLLPKYIEFHGQIIEIIPDEIIETDVITFSGAKGSYVENINNFVITLEKKPKKFKIERLEEPEPIPSPIPDPTPSEILPTGKFLFYKKPYEGISGYALYLPNNYYQSRKEYPLVIKLHGAGERAFDTPLERMVLHSEPEKSISKGVQKDFILICPQAAFTWKDEGFDTLKALKQLIEDAIKGIKVDRKRIYITGLSDGGMGTWNFTALFPEMIAAAVPICGSSNTDLCQAKDVPIWAFHNSGDKTVGVGGTTSSIKKLKDCGSKVATMTIYNESGHDAWTKTYNDPSMWEWLFQQTK